MGYCKKCGKALGDAARFCPVCGTKQDGAGNGADMMEQFDGADIADNRAMAALSYLGLLVLVPILAARESRFARFHAGQGLALLLVSAAYGIASGILASAVLAVSWRLSFVVGMIRLAGLAFPVLAVMGIVNAVNGQAKELPVIGKIRLFKS